MPRLKYNNDTSHLLFPIQGSQSKRFTNIDKFKLPTPLGSEYYHCLHFTQKEMEVISKLGNWKLGIQILIYALKHMADSQSSSAPSMSHAKEI